MPHWLVSAGPRAAWAGGSAGRAGTRARGEGRAPGEPGSDVASLELLDAVDPGAAQAARLADGGQVRDLVGDHVEHDVDLLASQVRTDAVVRAVAAEAELRVVLAGDVELEGVLEDLLVEVAAGVEHQHALAGLDQLATDLDVVDRGALEDADRGGPADDLVDHGRGALLLPQLPLVGVVEEG